MHDIIEQVENLTMQITTEPGIDQDRRLQITITTPDGTYKQRLEIDEGEIKWVSIPLKLSNGRIVTG